MHPALLLIPALGLVLGPRVWVNRVLREHDAEQDLPASASEVARALLDSHGLYGVQVEVTDLGDHYDPKARAVRLSRHHFDRNSLTAVTTAAHEVAHAIQHATGYPPFELRTSLARVAQVAGEIGTVLIVAAPVSFLLTRKSLPPTVVGSAALGMLGTSAAAQLAALPTELDASFKRALPMLQQGYIEPGQAESAQRILFACSLTYAAASLSSVLTVWPWMGRGGAALSAGMHTVARATDAVTAAQRARAAGTGQVVDGEAVDEPAIDEGVEQARPESAQRSAHAATRAQGSIRGGQFEQLVRSVAKPLIRGFLSRTPVR